MLRRSKGQTDEEEVDRLAAGDDPDALKVLARLLEREGYEVNRSTETDDALSALPHPYQAAVLGFTGRSTAMALLDAIRNPRSCGRPSPTTSEVGRTLLP